MRRHSSVRARNRHSLEMTIQVSGYSGLTVYNTGRQLFLYTGPIYDPSGNFHAHGWRWVGYRDFKYGAFTTVSDKTYSGLKDQVFIQHLGHGCKHPAHHVAGILLGLNSVDFTIQPLSMLHLAVYKGRICEYLILDKYLQSSIFYSRPKLTPEREQVMTLQDLW
jgi:hypothetical protein